MHKLSAFFSSILLFGLALQPLTAYSQYTINSLYGNLTDCDTMTRGIFIIWWDNDWNMAADADQLLDTMLAYRDDCLNILNMADPPNPNDGYYYNVYIHRSGDIFPNGWGNGQGTDGNGYPFLTLPVGAHNDWVNVAHETFHIFQYNANSPGFAYSGDSQWYIEASANWFAGIKHLNEPRAFVEAESLVRLPHVPLWLSYDNFPASYPSNWQRYVHQYAMAALLFYLTEIEGVSRNMITQGLFAGTNELPQEYYFNQLGGSTFRNYFINWATHMTNHFDFLQPIQRTTNENEWNTYADPADDNEFVQTYEDTGSNGWFMPQDTAITTGWSFNTYRIHNQSTDNYLFELKGASLGTKGDPAYFQGKVVVMNKNTGASFYDLIMTDDTSGSLILNVTSDDTSLYFIVASMPDAFSDVSQLFRHQVRITKGVLTGVSDGITPKPEAVVINRFNILGQPVNERYQGVQVIQYSDGTVRKEYPLRAL